MRSTGVVVAVLLALAVTVHMSTPVAGTVVRIPLTGGVLWPTLPNFFLDLTATVSNHNMSDSWIEYEDTLITTNADLALLCRVFDSAATPSGGGTKVAGMEVQLTLTDRVPELYRMHVLDDSSNDNPGGGGFPMMQFFKKRFIGLSYRRSFAVAGNHYLFQVEGLVWSIYQTDTQYTPLRVSGYFQPVGYKLPRRH